MTKKRLLAGLLTLVMLAGLLPTSALGARMDDEAIALEAPSDSADHLAAPVWEDAQAKPSKAELAEVDLTSLVNIAKAEDVTVENSGLSSNTQYLDTTAAHLMDGITDKTSSEYKWVNGGVQAYIDDKGFAPWVSMDFGETRSVGGIKIFFEKNDGQDVTYTYNIWTKASPQAEYVKWKDSVTATKKSSDYIQTYAFDQLTDVSAIKIEFLSAKTDKNTTDGAWIVLREVEIYGEEKPLDLSTLTNIAADGTVTTSTPYTGQYTTQDHPEYLTDGKTNTEFKWVGQGIQDYIATNGNPWVNFGFGENRSIGGLKITFERKDPDGDNVQYKYNILGKATGATEYETLFSGCTANKLNNGYIQTHAFTTMKELTDIKVEFTNESSNAWIVMTQLEIFGEAKETPPDEFDYTGLVNVTADCEVSVGGTSSEDAGLLSDGDIKGLWKASPASWPSNIDFALPGDSLIKRVEIDFERVANRSMDVALGYTQNSVTDTYFPIYSGTKTAPLDKTFAYTIEDGIRTDHLRITLSNPVPSTLGPAMTEVRIYISDEKLNLAAYEDITSYASVPAGTAGDGYKEWNLQSNQQVAGFKATLNGAESIPATVTGRLKRGGTWITYLTTLQNGENPMRFLGGMSLIRVNASADDLAKLTDFQIWGSYAEPVPDAGNLAYDRPVHSGLANTTAYLATDGDKTTSWVSDSYPTYLDIDLEANYDLSEIQVFTPAQGYSEYTLYTSIDGQNFTKVGEKLNNVACADGGDKHAVSGAGATARIVRIYLEYYSASSKPVLNEIRVIGAPSADTESHLTELPRIGDFSQSSYAAAINDADVIAEVQGILRRRVGEQYVDWFTFELAEGVAPAGSDTKYDYFTLTDEGGKIKVTGNNGVSLATGLNHYLKYYCYVNISQVGDQVTMPNAIVPIGGTVHKETKYPVRYAYNYCTHSYTMSFWNEAEWRAELDWLALNGVNVVLDITGQEMVWREFLMDMGYSHQDAKDFLAGPGYYAWAYMANLSGIGGPIHDKFLEDRAELGRKNQRIMRTLGMEPVLQAFSGMVPNDLAAHDSAAAKHILKQGVWSGCVRPDMLKTDTDTYERYAAAFYAAQKRVFGDAKYYATDPFHEGGNTGGMATNVVSRELLDSLIKNDVNGDAVWVIQSWQGNPSAGLLQGLREGGPNHDQDLRNHAIVLDLYAERYPHNNEYGVNTDSNPRIEFTDTPWVWCQLNNFGGRMGLDGHLNSLHESIPATANASDHMAGIGISPEASMENPLLYDFLFETVWTADATQPLQEIDLDQWLKDYARRRYGAESRNAEQAMAILADTVYNGDLRASKFTGNKSYQGAPESVINARPALSIGVASSWGNTDIFYSKAELEKAARLLLDDYDTLSASDAYLYDLADILKQVLSNSAQNVHTQMAAAYNSKNVAAFEEKSKKFLEITDLVNTVTGTRKEFLFGTWTGGAQQMAEGTDDFTKRIFLRNAKALVTTWFSYDQCVPGRLKDYSNRQWAGLTDTFYKARWTKWINAAKANLAAGSNGGIDVGDWFQWEWEYVRSADTFSTAPNGESLKTLGEEVLTNYSVLDPLGENELDPVNMTVKTGSEHTSQEDDAAVNVLDRDSGSIWHTEWTPAAAPKTNWWIAFDLGSVDNVDGLRYLPRQSNATGRIIGYDVFVSTDADAWNALANGAAWTDPADETQWKKVISSGSWANDANWKEASFPATSARYVLLHATASSHTYCSAAELRVTVAPSFSVTVDDAIQNGTVTVRRLVDGAPTELENGKTIAGAQLLVTGVPEGDQALTGVTVVRDGDAPEGVTDAEIAVTSQELEGGAHSFTFTMPAYPVTVSGAFKTKVSKPTVTAENNVFRVGRTLTAAIGGSETVDYQWYRHEAGHEPVMIQGETASTYVLAAADAGKTVFVKVTGTGSYAGWAQSDETAAILPAVVEVPENGITFTRANGITMWLNDHSGETTGPVVGTTTTVSANVTGTPTKPLTVTWESSATDVATIEAIPDDTNGNLTATLTAKKAGNATITVKMTAKDGTVERSATLPVTVKANITGITVKNGNDAVTELYLYANSDAELSAINGENGTKTNRAALTAELTEPTGGASAEEKKLNWTRSNTDNVLINFSLSEDTLTYTVDPVSKANTAQSNAKVGVKTITVSSQAKPTVNTTFKIYVVRHLVNDVTVTGTAQVGQELTAGIQRLNIPTDKQSGLTYKWFRLDSADAVAGDEVGTASSYTVQAADAGKYIKLEVTAAVNESAGFFYEGVKTVVTGQVAKMAGPAAPINLVGVHPTDASTNDGKITGLVSAVKYEYKRKTDSTWTAVDTGATQITGLSGDTTYEVRVKVENANAQEPGTAVEIRVPAYNESHKTITITAPEHGTVATVPSGSAAPGSTVTVTATPADGYVVDTLTVTDAENGPVAVTEHQFTMPDKDVTVTVTFRPTQITIHHILENMTCSLAEDEAAAGTNSHRVTYGEDPQITLIANTGYQLPNTLYDQTAGTGIFTDQEGTQRYDHYTFNEKTGLISFNENYFPTQDLWIKAKATKLTYNVAYTAQSGYTAPDGDRNVDYNGTYSVTITSNSGYRMPASITVKMKDAEGTYQTLATGAYTYTPNADKTSADISIPNIVGDVQITIVCEEITYAITGVTVTITHNDTATVEQDIPHVGDVLHANVTHEAPEGTPVTATYQWYRGTTPISGATVSSHTVTADDLGQALKVVVTGVKPFSGAQTSAATNQVKARVVHVDSVTVSPATSTLIVGKTLELTATVTPSDATNQKITWSSDDDTIASVSDAGLVTAHAAGSTVIRATTEDGGKTSTCAVTVEAAPARGVVLTGSAQVGETLTAEVFPAGIAHTMKWVRVAADGTETELTVTGSEYTLAEADQGSKLKVVVTIEEQEYTAESETVIAAPVVLKPAITLSASSASLPNAGGNVTLTVTVPTEITNGVVAVTCDVDSIVITNGAEDGVYTVTLPGGAATYTFTANLAAGILDNGTAYDSAEATCTVRVASPSRPSTGGNSGSTTTTETKDDGTKVTTVTKPDGTKVETTESPDGTKEVVETKKDGTVTATTETPEGDKSVVETKPDGSKTQTVEQADGTKSEMEVTKDGDVTITVTDESGEELVKTEIPATIPEPETKFEDVDTTPWAEEAIHKVAGLELVNGTGGNKYSPVAPMTRGSLATVLHRLSQGKTDYENTFKDVAQGKYYTEGVAWAAKANVVKGVSEDVFAPDDIITREQLAVMLARYAKLVGLNTKADAKTLEAFTDGEKTGAWAVDGMAWCVQSGILKGKGQNDLDPTANVTRAEVAVMLDRFIALLK